jgi:hypothetical protein
LLDARFKAILSLKEIIANFRVYSEEDVSDDRMKMRDREWTVEITRLPKKTWISENEQFEFDITRIAMRITRNCMASSSRETRSRRPSSGRRNIIVGDEIPTRRTIRTTIEWISWLGANASVDLARTTL